MNPELENKFDEIKLRKEMTRVNKLIAKHEAKLAALQHELVTTCPHERVEVKQSYTPGGYLNTGYYERWNQCMVCGARGPKETESDGMYG